MQAPEVMQRVKVYRLNLDGLWDDKGTGHVSVEFMEQSGSRGLIVISESDNRTLLIHRIARDDIYQRQGEDTIITWTDPELQTDIALSFQEAAGCNHVWEQIQETQQQQDGRRRENGLQRRPLVDEFDQPGASLEGDFPEGGPAGPVELPPAELGNLPEIKQALAEVSPFQRDRVAAQLMQPGYVRKLLDLFETCEDLEDMENLGHLFMIMRSAIMLNDTSLLEALMAEDAIMDVVGCLEYDPELQERQRHREFLQQSVVFKEVMPISDSVVRAKIHQTYRMGYLKDVILPRVLDDGTFATLSSLMLFNNVEVLMSLTQDQRFFPELFARLRELSDEAAAGGGAHSQAWTDLVAFLQELCGLSKHLQMSNRGLLLTKLNDLGLFDVMTEVIAAGDDALKLRATDVLLSSLQHDAAPLREFLEQQKERRLMLLLTRLLVDGKDGGVQEQVLEIWKVLLDPDTMDGAVEKNRFLEIFYEECIGKLTDTLANALPAKDGKGGSAAPAAASTLGLVVELLCFCVQNHQYRVKYYILRSETVGKVLKLLRRREKWLVVAALRFLRTCISLKDEFYNRYLVRQKLFEPVVDVFLANGDRYNLLNSAVLELFEFVRKENIKSLVGHLVEEFWPRLQHIDYVDTFRNLKLKHDQSQERGGGGAANVEVAAAREALAAARHRRDARALPKDEEDYFKEDDDDEDDNAGPGPSSTAAAQLPQPQGGAAAGRRPPPLANGSVSPPRRPPPSRDEPMASFPLVDYDDDSDDENANEAPGSGPSTPSSSAAVGGKRPLAPHPQHESPGPSPEIPPKRARSEDRGPADGDPPRAGPGHADWRR